MAPLKGQEMGRFKLGSTVINLFAPGKVNPVDELESLSVTKLGQPLAVSTEVFATPDVAPAPLPEDEIKAEHDASPLVDDKKTKANNRRIADVRPIIVLLMARCLSMGRTQRRPRRQTDNPELEQAKAAKPAQPETVESLQSALNALEERKGSLERAQQYQQVIDNFPKLSQTLRSQLNNLRDEPRQSPRDDVRGAESGDPASQQPAAGKAVWRSRSRNGRVKLPIPSVSFHSSKPMPAVS